MSDYKICLKCDHPKQDGTECPICGVIYGKAEAELERKIEISLDGNLNDEIIKNTFKARQGSKKISLNKHPIILGLLMLIGTGSWVYSYFYINGIIGSTKERAQIVLENGPAITVTQGNPQDQKIIKILLEKSTAGKYEQEDLAQQVDELQKSIDALRALGKHAGAENVLALLEQGDTDIAKMTFQNIFNQKQKEGQKSWKEAAEVARHLGILLSLDDSRQAIEVYRQATMLDPYNIDGWNQLGHLSFLVGELSEADIAYQTVLQLDVKESDKRKIAKVFCKMGEALRVRGELESAVVMYNNALKIDHALGDKKAMAIGYNEIGSILLTHGDLNKALDMFNKALELDRFSGKKLNAACNYSSLGTVYLELGELKNADEMYSRALDIFQALNNKDGIASCYINLGIVKRKRGDRNDAISMFNKSLEIFTAIGKKDGIANCYSNMGIIYLDRGELDNAAHMFKTSMEMYQSLAEKAHVANCYANLGYVHWNRGELNEAIGMFKIALALFREVGARPKIETTQKLLDSLSSRQR